MNKIYDSIDEIRMEENRKNEIRSNLLKEYEQPSGQPIRMRRNTAWGRVAAAALGVIVLAGGSTAAAGAKFHFDLNKPFQSYFGLDNQKDQKLQEKNVIQNPKSSDEHDGIVVEAEKVISTGKECFVWLKITVPEKMRPLSNPLGFKQNEMYQNDKSVKSSSFSYVYKEHVKPDASVPWNTILWQPEKGITYIQLKMGRAEGEKTWDDSTLHLKFSHLQCMDQNISDINTDSVWSLEVPVASSDETAQYTMEYTCPLTDENIIAQAETDTLSITGVTIRPFSISVEFQCPQAFKKEGVIPVIGNVTGYEKKDGSVVTFDIDEGSYSPAEIREDGIGEIYDMYYNYMDVENITAIFLDGQRIPLK